MFWRCCAIALVKSFPRNPKEWNRRFHDDGSSPPAGQRLVESGHRGLFAGHAAQRHLSQAEGAVPEDGPTSQSLIPGGLLLAQEQTQEPQPSGHDRLSLVNSSPDVTKDPLTCCGGTVMCHLRVTRPQLRRMAPSPRALWWL
ncbi:uncharacterized protein TNCT_183901 [Trichonephila clavata]|uniref:Uncharacterized protein n=1 Tax=Trichonephila clavata TaxID=2740835 RepID=A0A8X6KTI1_TRICU|nr:uncharacterized protein TNCT_183901 [Trichonephila clavata]